MADAWFIWSWFTADSWVRGWSQEAMRKRNVWRFPVIPITAETWPELLTYPTNSWRSATLFTFPWVTQTLHNARDRQLLWLWWRCSRTERTAMAGLVSLSNGFVRRSKEERTCVDIPRDSHHSRNLTWATCVPDNVLLLAGMFFFLRLVCCRADVRVARLKDSSIDQCTDTLLGRVLCNGSSCGLVSYCLPRDVPMQHEEKAHPTGVGVAWTVVAR